MTELQLHNSVTVVNSDNREALTLIEDTCCLSYEYFVRWKGSARSLHKTRDLRYFTKKLPQFPTGWTGKVTQQLRRHKIAYTISDLRLKPRKINLKILALPNNPWPHQEEALKAIQEGERGIVRVPTRGGKTLIMALTIAYFNVRTVVMVPNKTLLEQEYEVFSEVFGAHQVGRLGGGYFEIDKSIIVATIQTLASKANDLFVGLQIFRRTGCVIFDECHHVGHGGYTLRNTYFEVAQRCIGAYYRIGFTATPGRTLSLERQLLTGVAGKLIYTIDIEQLTERSILTPGRIDMVVLDRPHTPTLREFIEEQGIEVPPRADLELLCRKHHILIPNLPDFRRQLDDKITNNLEFRELVKFLAEYYASRGSSVIVLVSLVERGVIAFTQGEHAIQGAVGLSGQDKNRGEVLEDFKQNKFSVLVSTIVREGVDIPKADVIILASCDVQSGTPVLQRMGRVLTAAENKTQAIIVDFYIRDDGVLERHSKARMRLYDQNGFNINIIGEEEIAEMII